MKKILFAIAMLASIPVFAADTAPSPASIRELIDVTDAKKLIDGAYSQMDGFLDQAMQQSIGDKPVTAEQQRLLGEFRGKTVALMQGEMGWKQLEPVYLDLYAKTFTQAEVNGMLAFYKSDVGKAVTAKSPQLMQSVTTSMLSLMQGFMPKLQKLVEEYKPKLEAAAAK